MHPMTVGLVNSLAATLIRPFRSMAACLFLLAAACGPRYSPPAPVSPPAPYQPHLVLLPFHVVRDKQYVRTLSSDEVTLLEDGEEREITIFDGGPRTKIQQDILLLFDVGIGSVPFQAPAPELFQSLLLDPVPGLRLAVYGDDNLFMPFCSPTRNFAQFSKAIARVTQFGKVFPGESGGEHAVSYNGPDGSSGTANWNSMEPLQGVSNPPPPLGSIPLDPLARGKPKRTGWPRHDAAVVTAMKTAASWTGDTTRSVMLFVRGWQGGVDWAGGASDGVTELSRQIGITLYPVVLQAEDVPADADRLGSMGSPYRGLRGMLGLGQSTGGLAFAPEQITPAAASQMLAAVADRLRSEYVAGFEMPASTGPPRQHRVEVRLRSEGSGVVAGGVRVVTY
jgi:hypothetical protein